jgi:hypothetical protein
MRFQYLGGCAVALIYCGAVIGPWPAVAPWLKLTWEDWCVFGALAIGVHFLAGTAQVTHSLDLASRPHSRKYHMCSAVIAVHGLDFTLPSPCASNYTRPLPPPHTRTHARTHTHTHTHAHTHAHIHTHTHTHIHTHTHTHTHTRSYTLLSNKVFINRKIGVATYAVCQPVRLVASAAGSAVLLGESVSGGLTWAGLATVGVAVTWYVPNPHAFVATTITCSPYPQFFKLE